MHWQWYYSNSIWGPYITLEMPKSKKKKKFKNSLILSIYFNTSQTKLEKQPMFIIWLEIHYSFFFFFLGKQPIMYLQLYIYVKEYDL